MMLVVPVLMMLVVAVLVMVDVLGVHVLPVLLALVQLAVGLAGTVEVPDLTDLVPGAVVVLDPVVHRIDLEVLREELGGAVRAVIHVVDSHRFAPGCRFVGRR
jgi:hypothetical protein